MKCCEEHASELRCDDCPWCRIAQLEAENERLREALTDAIDGYAECAPYKGESLYAKHGDAKEIARLKEALLGGEE